MTAIKNEQRCKQSSNDPVQQSTQQPSNVDQDKIKNKVEEVEEWNVVISDQRRPQFRYSENFGRRNY